MTAGKWAAVMVGRLLLVNLGHRSIKSEVGLLMKLLKGMNLNAESDIVSTARKSGDGDDMARRRLQQKGDLYRQGGWWKLRWREDAIAPDGSIQRTWSKPVWIGPCEGVGRFTEKQAQRIAWDNFLSRLDQNNCVPLSVMTVTEFVERKFVPEHVAMKKTGGRIHYWTVLKHVLRPEDVDRMFQVDPAHAQKPRKSALQGWPYLSDLRLRDVRRDDVQRLVSAVIARGLSVQTAKHVRNAVSAVFTHAKQKQWYAGDNPAALVALPEMVRREAHALTFKQAQSFLRLATYPEREMALIGTLTSMNVAEICGLQWKRVNLSAEWSTTDGEAIPPMTIAVRKQWYLGELGSVKRKTRLRDLPIPAHLIPLLEALRKRKRYRGPDDFVLVSRTGTPVDAHNIANRRLKKIGKALGMPWLSWHVFRRSHTTLAKELGMEFQDRMAMMGHGEARMTALYTHESIDRRRKVVDAMAAKLLEDPEGEKVSALMKQEAGLVQ